MGTGEVSPLTVKICRAACGITVVGHWWRAGPECYSSAYVAAIADRPRRSAQRTAHCLCEELSNSEIVARWEVDAPPRRQLNFGTSQLQDLETLV